VAAAAEVYQVAQQTMQAMSATGKAVLGVAPD